MQDLSLRHPRMTQLNLVRLVAARQPCHCPSSIGSLAASATKRNWTRCRLRACFRGGQIIPSLRHALEEFVAFAQSAYADILVLQHRFDDAKDRFRAQVIAAVEHFNLLEDFIFAKAGIFDRALLVTFAAQEVGFALVREPAVEFGLFVKFRARIGRGERNLDAEHVEFLGEIDGVRNGFTRLDGQAENEGAVDKDVRLLAGPGEPAHFLHGHAFFDAGENVVVAGFVTDQEQAQAVVLEGFYGVVINVRPAVATPGQTERADFFRDFARAREVGREGVVVEEEFFDLRKYFFAWAISSATFCAERTRYLWPPMLCGQRQKVHWAGQPRPVYMLM